MNSSTLVIKNANFLPLATCFFFFFFSFLEASKVTPKKIIREIATRRSFDEENLPSKEAREEPSLVGVIPLFQQGTTTTIINIKRRERRHTYSSE